MSEEEKSARSRSRSPPVQEPRESGNHFGRGQRNRSRSNSSERKPRQQEEPNCQVYASNLQEDCTSDELMDAFTPYGNVIDVRKKGHFAFIKYDSNENALNAIEAMNGSTFQGQRIRVEKAKPFVPRQQQQRGGPDECWECGKTGHKSFDCPQKSGRGGRGGYGGRGGGFRDRGDDRDREGFRGRGRGFSRGGGGRDRSRSPRRNDDRGDRDGGYRPRYRSRSRSGSQDRDRGRRMNDGKCFGCGEQGHIRMNCPSSSGPPRRFDRGGSRGGHRRDY